MTHCAQAPYDLRPGCMLAHKYKVLKRIGKGWEGEVYLVRERGTSIERAAKLFFPKRNHHAKTARTYAQRLHKLRHCSVVIQYHAEETLTIHDETVTMLLSEYVEGESITELLKRQPGKRLHPFQALHLLHALAEGLAAIHHHKDYHGDLHADNILVNRVGLGFELKFMDFYRHKGIPKRELKDDDVFNAIHIFYEALGGQRLYAKQPQYVKDICRGLKHNLIKQRFPNAIRLKAYIEALSC